MKLVNGLRLEIVFNITLLVGAALLLVSFLLLKMTERELLAERVARSRSIISLVTGMTMAPGRSDSDATKLAEVEALLRRLSADPTLRSWRLVDGQLQKRATFAVNGEMPDRGNDLQQARLDRNPIVRVRYSDILLPFIPKTPADVTITGGLFSAGRFLGAIQLRTSLVDIQQRMARAMNLVFVYVLCYGAVLVLFGVYLLERNVVRPIRRLEDSTRQVADGNLQQRLSLGGPREISSLAKSFNSMLEALQTSRSALEERNQLLEKSNAELSQARRELIRSEKMASVGHLAAGMAHEIGNPLGAVVGYLGLLKQEMEAGRPREIVTHALAESERIDRLVRDLLDFATPSATILDELDLAAVAREAVERLSAQHSLPAVQLDLKGLPLQLPPVLASRHKLLQVIINLLLNARDASAAGGMIHLSGGKEKDRVWLAVADEGCGIKEDQLEKIFDPFFTTKAPDKGRGLGLAVCHRIVEEAGGTIGVESTPGQGSRFVLELQALEGGEK